MDVCLASDPSVSMTVITKKPSDEQNDDEAADCVHYLSFRHVYNVYFLHAAVNGSQCCVYRACT